jgi:poly(3-hydroxybutyrate) depolymerase
MRILTLLLATALTCLAKPVELEFPGLTERVLIELPDNYDASKKWPAVFYYHGTGGKPTTRFITQHTGRQDWIVVGMAYRQKGKFNLTTENYADELQILHSTRQYLTAKYGLDPKRVYVAGFSKGGWMAEMLIQRESSLAGAIIMGAGHLHKVRTQTGPFKKRTPIYLGIGRQDGNYPFALRAVTYFRELRAPITLDTWHDRGHNFPAQPSHALTQWLALEAAPTTDHTQEATSWITAQLSGIEPMNEPVAQWLALRDLEATPYFKLLEDKPKVTTPRKNLEKTPVVAPEAKALAAHRKLLVKEISSHDKTHYEHLFLAYLKLSDSAAGTRQGKIAAQDHLRLEKLLKHYSENERLQEKEETPFGRPKTEPVKPNFPEIDRGIPRNPLIK